MRTINRNNYNTMTQEEICRLLDSNFIVLRRYYESENLRGKQKACVRYAVKNAMINNTCIGYSWRVKFTFSSNEELDEYMEKTLKLPFYVEYQ